MILIRIFLRKIYQKCSSRAWNSKFGFFSELWNQKEILWNELDTVNKTCFAISIHEFFFKSSISQLKLKTFESPCKKSRFSCSSWGFLGWNFKLSFLFINAREVVCRFVHKNMTNDNDDDWEVNDILTIGNSIRRTGWGLSTEHGWCMCPTVIIPN